MNEKAKEIFAFIQQRCLWQTHSREWDRKANIEGVMNRVDAMLTGKEIVNETLLEKAYYADAKILTEQLEERFGWLKNAASEEIDDTLEQVKKELYRIFVDECLNAEIKVAFY